MKITQSQKPIMASSQSNQQLDASTNTQLKRTRHYSVKLLKAPTLSTGSAHHHSLQNKNLSSPKVQQLLPIKLDGFMLSNNDKLPPYSQAMQKVADYYQCVIGLRYPSESAFGLLNEGMPSKNFHVKAKSSISGPMAGFISEKSEYSKVPPEKYANQSAKVKEALAKGANLVQLSLTGKRINELLDLGSMKETANKTGELRRFQASFAEGKIAEFVINKEGLVFEKDGVTPVNVLTNPPLINDKENQILDKPITADYDLFCIYPKKNLSNNPRPLNLTPAFKSSTFIKNTLSQLFPLSQGNQQEDADMGNVHQYNKTVIKTLNKAVTTEGSDPYKGGTLFWHNDETGNPFTPGFSKADKPLFFIPSLSKPLQVDSLEDLNKLNEALSKIGYSPEINPKFTA